MAAVAAAPPVRSKVKKAGQRARRNSSSSDTESANSIGPDSDEGESGPPIILEDVAPSEKIRSKKAKKASERPNEAADESEVKKKEKKHKKHKTADGDEKSETKHKKKHKERSESPGGTKEKKSSSRSKSSKKAKETSEAVVGGGEDDKPKPTKPKPPKPPPPTRTISESSGNEGSEASSILEVKKSAPETAIPPPIPEEGDENKADNEAKKEEEPEVPPEGIKASVAFKWRKAMTTSSNMWTSSTNAVKETTLKTTNTVKTTTVNAATTVKTGTVNAATSVKDGTVNAATAVKDKTVKTTTDATTAVKDSTAKTATAVKSTTNTATSAVSNSFFGVVGMARKAAQETKHKMGPAADKIYLIHFNDVYNIESGDKEPVGGAARFLTAVKSHGHLQPLVLFSGDCFAPSTLSTFTKGEQMVPVLNKLDVRCSVFGNHDFDFGIDTLMGHVEKTNFPWLMSNVIDNETGRPLADGKVTHIIDWCGRKIGLIGLVEKEWLDTLSTINPEEVTYTDYVESGQALAKELRAKGCQFIIALTHMRTPNDLRLAANASEIDLILGGHDHVYEKKEDSKPSRHAKITKKEVKSVDKSVQGTFVLKSGTDFRQFSVVTVDFSTLATKPVVEIDSVEVTQDFEPDNELATALEKYSEKMEVELIKELGEFECDLEGRFSAIRTQETNLGNFICDIMVAATNADFAILNSGTLRSDCIHSAGPFFMKDLLKILPMIDPLVLLEITGSQIIRCLENGVSMHPKLEGRFPQVSGISFAFDGEKPAGQRIDPAYIKIGDEYLNPERTYRMVTKAYLANGKDGYDVLAKCNQLIDEENGPTLAYAVQNHFAALAMREGRTRKSSVHHQSLVTLSRKNSVMGPTLMRGTSIVKQLTEDGTHHLPAHVPEKFQSMEISGKTKLTKQTTIGDLEVTSLNPKVEGRIRLLNSTD